MRLLVAAAASLALAGCTPEPPRITPKSVSVVTATSKGLDLDVTFEAYNPNGVDLSTRSVSAKVVVAGSVDLGTVTSDQAISLPAKKTTVVHAPLHATWSNLAGLAVAASRTEVVPYTVDGHVRIGGALSIEVPFTLAGTLTRQELLGVAAGSFPFPPAR